MPAVPRDAGAARTRSRRGGALGSSQLSSPVTPRLSRSHVATTEEHEDLYPARPPSGSRPLVALDRHLDDENLPGLVVSRLVARKLVGARIGEGPRECLALARGNPFHHRPLVSGHERLVRGAGP